MHPSVNAAITPTPRRRLLAVSVQAAIIAIGFMVGFIVWRWSNGRQSESLLWFMAIWVPWTLSVSLASWAGARVRRQS